MVTSDSDETDMYLLHCKNCCFITMMVNGFAVTEL